MQVNDADQTSLRLDHRHGHDPVRLHLVQCRCCECIGCNQLGPRVHHLGHRYIEEVVQAFHKAREIARGDDSNNDTLVIDEDVQRSWTGEGTSHLSFLPSVSAELVKVSLFLASFSGLYFMVSAVTDDTYRGQFFASVMDQLERAVGVRAVYLALRAQKVR